MMTLVVLLCFSHLVGLLLLLPLSQAASSSSSSSSTLELSVGLRLSPNTSSFGYFEPMPNATMFSVAIPASVGQEYAWFLPILSSPSFNSSNSSQSPGFSFGFFYHYANNEIYLAVCGGLSGNFSNLMSNISMSGAEDSGLLVMPSVADGYAVPVWIANPFTSLKSIMNASLVVVEVQGGSKQLQLEDYDGKVLWKVSNVGQLMEMQDTGTLTIYDTINRTNVVWQSPPRDTLFRGEKLGVGMQLTSNDSSYLVRLEKGGLVLYFNTLEFMGERPAPYWVIPALLSQDDNLFNLSNKVMSSPPCINSSNMHDTGLYAILDEDSNLNINPGPNCSHPYLRLVETVFAPFTTGPLSFVKLENDGWLRNYAVPLDLESWTLESQIKPWQLPMWKYYFGDMNPNDVNGLSILQVELWDTCSVPNACGPHGVCTPHASSPCTCPTDPSSTQAASTFQPIDENNLSKGCTRRKMPPNCTQNDQHVKTTDFLQLNHTASIFLFGGWLFNSTITPAKVDTCKTLCSSNCSCNGFFYVKAKYNSACYFITDENLSLLNLTTDFNNYEWPTLPEILKSNYVTYLKTFKVDQTSGGLTDQPAASPLSSRGIIGKSIVIAIAIASSFVACVGLAFTMLLLYSRARKRKLLNKQARQAEEELREVLPLLPTRFSYQHLHEATKGFTKILGSGGCGSVYAGTLQDGREVAIKTLEFSIKGQTKQFLAEVATIGQTSHHNIVRLVGFCWEMSSRLLVYEYMERGSLDHWLFQKPRPTGASCDDEGEATLLDWRTRYNVVLGIIRGLAYLHEECPQPILHFDIKPQNILLDGAFEAKLADFGMSRLIQRDVSKVVTGLRGTPGYIAPEWLLHGAVSKKGDIYSMGMVLLEIVGGRKNVDLELLNNVNGDLDDREQHEQLHFPSWAARKCEQGLEMELVDKRLQGTFNEVEARRLIYTAFWCIQEDPAMRPSAPTALKWLEGSSLVEQPQFSRASQCSLPYRPFFSH